MIILIATLAILMTASVLLLAFIAWQQHRIIKKISASYTDQQLFVQRRSTEKVRHYA